MTLSHISSLNWVALHDFVLHISKLAANHKNHNNMGQIIIPTDRKINGPWILDLKSLEELNEVLLTIEEKLEQASEVLLTKTAESYLEEYKDRHENIDLESAKLKVKNINYKFNSSEKFALIITKQGNKIKDDNLLSILKGNEINEYNPTELKIHIRKGPCEFTLEVTTNYQGELETRIKSVDDDIFNDINYEINKWIENHKPTLIMQKWSGWFPFAAFPIIMMLVFATPLFIKNDKDAYKTQLEQKANFLLKDGLTPVETTKAIEIILQHESDYVPETFKQDNKINEILGTVWIITILGLIILMIKPNTVIGLGKSRWKIKFYKRWIYFVLVFIPLSIILPILRSKLI
ncbi:hypothetical protein V5J73_05710 [Flavobacterium sp. KS-LB2]|uniref:hypothetical protein n=1 Tax=Flavobacterium sp. KS-LB2 TaxID=3120525 RepID=UPI0030D09740